MPENEMSDPRLIEPFWVMKSSRWMPAKVNVPPGAPEVMVPTLTRARLVVAPVGTVIVGLPANSRSENLNTATGRLFCDPVNTIWSNDVGAWPNKNWLGVPSRAVPR